MRALGPLAALQASIGLFRARPLVTLALGAALLTSLISVFCGVGAFAAAWFLCELFALQFGIALGAPPRRTRAWLWAGFVQALAVLVLASVAALALLTVGPDVWLGISRNEGGALEQAGLSVLLIAIAGSLSLTLTVHFEHAPSILIDRGGGLASALLESARLVRDSGSVRTWLTSVVAHGLQLVPLAAAFVVASASASMADVPLWAVFFIPVAALCLALGQGMVVASYLAVRERLVCPSSIPAQIAPSRIGAAVWSGLLVLVLSGPVCVTFALLKPSRPAEHPLDPSAQVGLELLARTERVARYIPDTALSLEVDKKRVRVVASDGGGAGRVPLPDTGIALVRAARVFTLPTWTELLPASTSAFAIEITLRDGRTFTTYVDDAGVRLDDSAARRLAAALPAWALWALALCLASTALWIGVALPPQARLRCDGRLPERSAEELEALRKSLRRRALLASLWLVPSAVTSLSVGLWAALG